MSERPIYETVADIRREADVAGVIASLWKCTTRKMKRLYSVDFALMRGKEVMAWAEIKCRDASYPTFIISLKKWMDGLELAEASGSPFLIIVSWPVDGVRILMYHRVERKLIRVIFGGRTDRSDPDDVEPLVEIPVTSFKVIA